MDRASGGFPVFRPTLAQDYSISGFSQKICSTLNPSKFVKTPLSSRLPPEWCVWITYLADRPNRGPPWLVRQPYFLPFAPIWRKASRYVGFPKKIGSTLIPSQFVKKTLPSSPPPEWCVWVSHMADHPNRAPPCVVRRAAFLSYAPLWRKTTR